MGVGVARSGDTGEYGSFNLTDRLHDDHLHDFRITYFTEEQRVCQPHALEERSACIARQSGR